MAVGLGEGGGGCWVRICVPFFKNQKSKITKNWEKLNESG